MKAIKLEAERLVERKTINGVEFFVGVSPYFFPERLECDYSKKKGALVITFGYLDNEPVDPEPYRTDHLVEISVGVHTRRVLQIVVYVDRNDVDKIDMLVSDGVPKAFLAMEMPKDRPEIVWNYKMIRDAVLNHSHEFAQIPMQ